ncbi:hypothetical protein DFH08DRAFT_808998 [Mycena albidolilacea]|uniref:Uncharacterized protein n=1 Tax=Mycena albidolilacea TaxID=1033008 RepID=A0AAD7A1T7_9AGAR|nr:hypothetical protein DFH08DRAFT_808998 [Mycena albidolilacea]
MLHSTPHIEATPKGSSLSVMRVASNEQEKCEQQATTEVDKEVFPHGLKLVVLTVALCLAVFLAVLYNSIIATAIPKVTKQFKSLPDVGWFTLLTSMEAHKLHDPQSYLHPFFPPFSGHLGNPTALQEVLHIISSQIVNVAGPLMGALPTQSSIQC